MWLPLLAIALVCSAQDAGYYPARDADSSHQAGRYGYGHHGFQDGYAPSPPQDRYAPSSSEDRYGAPSSEDRYGVPSSEDRYGAPSSEDRYGVPSSEDRYGVSPSEDGYTSSTSATEEKAFLVAGSRSCSGTEVERQQCRDMPTCNHCVPQNCEFAQWGKWYDAGGCTGLCFRHRALAQPNNECGRPCSGVQEDTKPCFKRECSRKPEQDAMFGSWSEWGLCDSGQRDRHREVATQAAHGGRSVEGPLREVQPCGQGHVVDCEMNQWNAWTTCSCTCGQGWHTRDRRIIRFSANGGKPCVGSTREEHPCNEQPCNGLACQFSPWSSWAGCDGYRPFQRDRHRRVEQPGSDGAGCSGTTHEMEGCTSHGPSDCVISQWDQWSSCDKHCDGGQQVRHRKLIHPAHSGGTCPQSKMKQIRGCNTHSCHSNQNDCILSPWRSWSACTAQCEDGVRKREREVLQRAGEGGRGCSGVMMQVVSCTGPGCGEQDCQWGAWDSWSGCSCSCGGGTKRRNRQVQVSPKGGGELCDPVDKSEAAPCNQHRCFERCTDARWSEWKQWSECSASCGYGFKFRHRSHQVQANSCGRPATGRGQEWDVCEGSGVGSAVCGDRDGRLSAWNEWSDCSCTCFGIRERQRIVEQYHFGNGKCVREHTVIPVRDDELQVQVARSVNRTAARLLSPLGFASPWVR